MSDRHLVSIVQERDRADRLAKAMEARVIELERELADSKQETANLALEWDDLLADNRKLEDRLRIAELAHDQRLAEIDQLKADGFQATLDELSSITDGQLRIFDPDAPRNACVRIVSRENVTIATRASSTGCASS
jgi:hypothetical protein